MAVTATIGAFVQVVVAILIVVGFFMLAFFIYNKEAIEAAIVKRSVKLHTYVFRGIKDLNVAKNEVYDTSDRMHPTFRDLPNSVNQLGGAEFTYSFWMYKPEKTSTKQKLSFAVNDKVDGDDLILLVRGNNRQQRFKDVCNVQASAANNVMVKCPLIKFQGQNWEYLVVELNTANTPDGVKEQSRKNCASNKARTWSTANSHKIALSGFNDINFINKWFMVTVVVSDTEPTDNLPVRNKIHVRIYINGVLELDRYVDNELGEVSSENPSVLMQNAGPLYVAPTLTGGGAERTNPVATDLFMANLSYMSYVAKPDEIQTLYKAGFDRNIASSVNQSVANEDRYRASMKNRSMTTGVPQLTSF